MAKDRKQTGTDSQAERDLREEQARARGEQDTSDERPGATAGPERHATPVQREGMDLLGRSSVRDDAIPGVSDASARTDQGTDTVSGSAAGREGVRRNPPLREDGA